MVASIQTIMSQVKDWYMVVISFKLVNLEGTAKLKSNSLRVNIQTMLLMGQVEIPIFILQMEAFIQSYQWLSTKINSTINLESAHKKLEKLPKITLTEEIEEWIYNVKP